jgi:IclR family pca regulon transcriptional regulator
VLSLAKGFRVLEIFSAQTPEMNLSQIADKADLDAGTAHRLVKTLVMLGYLRKAAEEKRYRLGLKVLDMGFNAIVRTDLHAFARPLLRGLLARTNDTASMGVLDGGDVVHIERVESGLGRLGVTHRIGSRIPAYSTALGHAMLAHLPGEQRLRALNLRERIKLTPETPALIEDIEARLAQVRQLGYALSDQLTTVGVRVLAAPILDEEGLPLAAVSVAAASFTCSLEIFVERNKALVMEVAESLGRVLRISGSTAQWSNGL